MELHKLPDLSGWRVVEIWTIEEAAMIWAAIDPLEHLDTRIDKLRNAVPAVQHKKAWLYQRAISEAICRGTLPFVEAWEWQDDYQNGPWAKKTEFPVLPDPNTIIHHMTRLSQAAFIKWADSKKMPSYRQDLKRAEQNPIRQVATPPPVEVTSFTEVISTSHPLALPAPAYLDAANPLSPQELRASVDAWEAITSDGSPMGTGVAIKASIRKFLDRHTEYGGLSNEAKIRICTLTNWNKKGGAPKTPG